MIDSMERSAGRSLARGNAARDNGLEPSRISKRRVRRHVDHSSLRTYGAHASLATARQLSVCAARSRRAAPRRAAALIGRRKATLRHAPHPILSSRCCYCIVLVSSRLRSADKHAAHCERLIARSPAAAVWPPVSRSTRYRSIIEFACSSAGPVRSGPLGSHERAFHSIRLDWIAIGSHSKRCKRNTNAASSHTLSAFSQATGAHAAAGAQGTLFGNSLESLACSEFAGCGLIPQYAEH